MRSIKTLALTAMLAVTLTLVSSVVSPALAQEAPTVAADTGGSGDMGGPGNGFDAAVDADDLRTIAGREDIGALVAQADQRNVVSNNSVTGNSVTGGVTIDGNAFQNLQGMAVISANSGNNVAMNAAMNVTINMAPR